MGKNEGSFTNRLEDWWQAVMVLQNKSGVRLSTTKHRHDKSWYGRNKVFIKMLHNLGEWRTPQLQVTLFYKTQTNLICSPKDWNSKLCWEVPIHSYLSFWSPDLLSRGLSSFSIPLWRVLACGASTAIARPQLPVLGIGAAEDCCSWPCTGSSMGPSVHWVHVSRRGSQKKRKEDKSLLSLA